MEFVNAVRGFAEQQCGLDLFYSKVLRDMEVSLRFMHSCVKLPVKPDFKSQILM